MPRTKLKQKISLGVEALKSRLSSYVGGQMEIQNQDEGYFYRGEIEKISIMPDENGGALKVRFSWLAKATKFDYVPSGGWTKEENLDYGASFLIYSVSDIGDGRTALNSWITHELAVLFPEDGSKMKCPF